MCAIACHFRYHLVAWQGPYEWKQVLGNYWQLPEKNRMYRADDEGRPIPCDSPPLGPERISLYHSMLSAPPPYRVRKNEMAVEWVFTYEVRYTEDGPPAYQPRREVRFQGLPDLPCPPAHDLQKSLEPRQPLTIPWLDLVATAQWMDEQTAQRGLPQVFWKQRLERMRLETCQPGHGFIPSANLTFNGLYHLCGMVGAGKSTLMDVLAVHLSRLQQSITVHTLAFPEVWRQAVRRLQSSFHARRKTSPEPSALPVRILNRALRALLPQLLTILPGADRPTPSPWLVAWSPLPAGILLRVMSAWVRIMYQDRVENRELVLSVLEELQDFQPVWETRTWQTADWKQSPPPDDPLYHLLPAVLAETLVAPESRLFLDGRDLAFRRAQSSPDRPGSELFSWPPLTFFGSTGKSAPSLPWYYSVLLTLTLQTRPLNKKPVIHAEWGIRRWVSQPLRHLPWGIDTSVFLSGQPLLDENLSATSTFQVAPLSSSSSGVTWGSRLPELLGQWGGRLPDPQALCEAPHTWLNPSGDRHVAIVYRPALGQHLVAPGISVAHRRQLTVELAARLDRWVTLCSPLKRSYPIGRARIRLQSANQPPLLLKDGGTAGAPSGAPSPVIVEIYTRQTTWPEATPPVEPVPAREGQTASADTATAQTFPVSPVILLEKAIREAARGFPGGVEIHHRPLGVLADKLSGKEDERGRRGLQKACQERLRQVCEHVPPTTGIIPAFVELPGEDHFTPSADPKPILRVGLAKMGRLTQFFTPDVEDVEKVTSLAETPPRIEHTVKDMLRQMGHIRALPDPSPLNVPALKLVGLWLLHPLHLPGWQSLPPLPVMVQVDTRTQQVLFWMPGQEIWIPYPHGLLGLARKQLHPGPVNPHPAPLSPGWLLQVIRQHLAEEEDVLLLVYAGNMRRLWPWLENRNVALDGLAADSETPYRAETWGRLRVVRLRDGRGGETPEWYAEHVSPSSSTRLPMQSVLFGEPETSGTTPTDPDAGLSAGVFVHPEIPRLFFSAYHPPPQFKYRRNSPLEKPVWNPALVEILPLLLQKGDEPAMWAAYVHELRRALPHYTEAVILPLPLHLAALAEEYALPVQWQDKKDE